MPLGREDATRIIRFCMAGAGWGTATRDDDVCVVKIVESNVPDGTPDRFEGINFEEALRAAAAAGRLKAACLEKQISFMARALPDQPGVELDVVREPDSAAVRAEVRLFPTLVASISALVHETQRERGTSSLFASSRGRLFEREMRRQWEITDERRQELVSLRESNPAGLPRGLAARLDRTTELMAGLVEQRNEVTAASVSASDVIARYTRVNADLLGIIDELAGRAVAARAKFPALAWVALLHAKEKTGIERAQLCSAFAWDHFHDDQHAVVAGLIAARQTYLHLFSVAAPSLAREILQRTLSSPIEQAVVDMERVAIEHRDGGFGIDPAAWFDLISRKIDSFGEVETAVRATVAQAVG
jgi:methyl-accepting chemotaxis protein